MNQSEPQRGDIFDSKLMNVVNKSDFQNKLSSEQNDKECDARDDDSITEAGNIRNKNVEPI
jgi:hypothetical protein